MSTIGVIGLGNMGRGMALSLQRGGFSVVGTDASEAARVGLAAEGIEVVDSIAAVAARADVIVLSLPTAEIVAQVVSGPDGLLSHGRKGLLVIDTSTSHPDTTRQLSAQLAEAGMALIDAPVSGGPKGAISGQLTMVIGGAAAHVERAEPVLSAMSAKRIHIGEVGAGHLAKIANNLLLGAHLLAAGEVAKLATSTGVSVERLLDGINAGSGRSGATQVNFPTWILNDAFDSGFSMKLMRKDVRLAAELIARTDLAMPLSTEVTRLWNLSAQAIGDEEDFNRIVELGTRLSALAPGSYIGGTSCAGSGEEVILVNPVTGEKFASYADAGAELVAKAAEAAIAGQREWAALSHAQRGRVMFEIGRVIRAHLESVAQLESCSVGKPIRDCRAEVLKVAEMFEYYAGWTDKLHGDVIPVPSGHLNYTRREPYGVVLLITPWNAPVFTCGWNVAPAIAAGNAVLLKPSELTPSSSIAVAMLAEKAGLPKGVINVISGLGHTTGQAAIAHPAIRKVVFIGSPVVGAKVASAAASRGIPCVLELGGKSANIVFEDADLTKACVGAQSAIFSAAGQSCVAGSRLLVQRSVYDRFVSMVAAGARQLQVGDPLSAQTEVGPIQNAKQYEHVLRMIKLGLREGAEVAEGSKGDAAPAGYFVRPTILKNVRNDMQIARTEIFGPVVVAIPFDTEEEAIAIANDSEFGLAGAVWTNNVARAHRVAAQVKAGTFWINTYKVINVASPFGGYGASGYGRSSGAEALHEYTQVKSVWVETSANPGVSFGYAPQ